MAWIIILLALALAFGPVLYLLPTRRDRRLAAIRLEARKQGLLVELKPVRKLDAAAAERVTAAGKRRSPVHDSVAYAMPLRGPLERIRPWRLLRAERSGWEFDSEWEVPADPEVLPEVLPLLHGLPDDSVAVEFGGGTIACYWLERFPADNDTVRSLKASLEAIAGRLTEIDAERTLALFDGDR